MNLLAHRRLLAAAVLEAAGDRIDDEGFAQGVYFDEASGSHCARGAVYLSAALLTPGRMLVPVVETAVDTLCCRLGTTVEVWNDADGRTGAEVASALRDSARELRAAA